MAKEGERSAPVDKGKGKAEDVKDVPAGKKPQKDEKQQANGKKKDEEPQEGRSSISTRGRQDRQLSPTPLEMILTWQLVQRSSVRRTSS